MKIACVVNARIPTEKAHGYQIMRVMSEWAKLGHEVALYVPARRNPIQDDPFAYYGIEPTFPIMHVPCIDALRFARLLGPLAFFITNRSFLYRLKLPKDYVVYTRDADTVAYLGNRGYVCVYNAHNWAPSRATAIAGALGVVCNSKGTERAVASATKLPTMVAYNAADENPWVGSDKHALREALGLLQDKQIALYAGHLYGWKGTRTLVEAARLVPDLSVVLVGGTPDEQKLLGKVPDNVLMVGHKHRRDVEKYLAAADMLVLPNTKKSEESAQFTSPLKMFEYMASGTPIISSDLPSLREVLSGDTAYFVEPDSARSLAEALRVGVSTSDEASAKAARALDESRHYTWRMHAVKVSEFILSLWTS